MTMQTEGAVTGSAARDASRELDALIAEKVMGWRWFRTWRGERFMAPGDFVCTNEAPYRTYPTTDMSEPEESGRWWLEPAPSRFSDLEVVPAYSTDDASTFRALATLRDKGYGVEIMADPAGDYWSVRVWPRYNRMETKWHGHASFALAACRAMLAAVDLIPLGFVPPSRPVGAA